MRPLHLLSVLLVAFCAKVHAEIKTSEAGNHVGESMVVRGIAVQVSKVGDLTFLNFGRPHPESQFTAVIKGDPSVPTGQKHQIQLRKTNHPLLAGRVSS